MRDKRKVGLFISSGHPLFVEGMRMILRDNPAIQLVGNAQQFIETVEKVKRLHPQVVLLDLPITDRSGKDLSALDAISRMKETDGKLMIIALTLSGKLKSVARYRKVGVSGVILPETPLDRILHRILASVRTGGERNISAGIAGRGSRRRKPTRLRTRSFRIKRGRNI